MFKSATTELDPVKRAGLLIKCNEMIVADQVVIPVVSRPDVAAVKSKLGVDLSGWDSNMWDLPHCIFRPDGEGASLRRTGMRQNVWSGLCFGSILY